jgi:anti-anti-sigma factor
MSTNSDFNTKVSSTNDCVTISIRGAFSFPLYQKFRDLSSELTKGKQFIVDLSETTYMDSSALGMLLHLREQVGTSESRIEIKNCRPEIRKILAIAHFDKIFTIN